VLDTEFSPYQDLAQAPIAAEVAFLEDANQPALLDRSGSADLHPQLLADLMDGVGVREIVFVDENITDYQTLISDLQGSGWNRNLEVVKLKRDQNGIRQVTQALSERSNLSALHFITHGVDGQIALGDTCLNSTTLQQNTYHISAWGKALIETGDLLFYGCNIASGREGENLLHAIALLTGADVAASDDLTGNAQFGGDWVLEYDKDKIETAVAINNETQQNWNGLLAIFSVNTTADTIDANPGDGLAQDASGNTSLRAAIMEANASAGADTVSLATGTYILSRAGANEDGCGTGDLDITGDLTITGVGANTAFIDGGAADRVLQVRGGSVTLSGVTIQNGAALDGGGIRVDGPGSLTLRDAAITNNHATSTGGGILVSGTLNADRVTIEGNIADVGGGIYVNNGASASLLNATLSGNAAASNGGAIFTRSTINITNSTIAYNNAAGAGGNHKQGSATATLKNSILANNTGGNANGALTSVGNNIDSDGTAGLAAAGDQSGTVGTPIDVKLGPLQHNGGTTKTHALLAGSPAIDPAGLSGAPAVDQRGYTRDATPDIGAYEFNAGSSNQAPTLTSFAVPVDTTAEDTEVEVTLAELKAQGDEADVDGTVDAFVVKAVSTGTLKIGATAGTATAWAAGTNDTIDATNNAYWTPANNANGTLNSITAVAKDNDGAESATPVQVQVTVTPVNDTPVVTSVSLTVIEGQTVTLAPANFGITDPDDGSFTYTVSAVSGGYFQLSSAPGTPITTFTSADLAASLVQFVDDGNEVAPAFSVTVNDGNADSNSLAATVTYTPVNDAPVITVPAMQLMREGATLVFNTTKGNAISVGDADAGSGIVRVTLTAANGTLSLSGTAGLTFLSGIGTDDANMSFTGTLISVNAAVDGLSFTATPNVAGGANLDISVHDLGNTGAGGAQSASSSVPINVAGFFISPTSGLLTGEGGGTASFNVVLRRAPTADVTVAISSSDTSEGDVSVSSLTFTTADWNVPRMVTVSGVDDFIIDGDVAYSVITGAATSSDGAYAGLNPVNVSLINVDNSFPDIVVNPTSGLVTTEAGGTAQFSVVLATQPFSNVVIPVSSSDTGEGTVSVSSLTFTAGNWLVPQVVTVTGVNDFLNDGMVGYTIILGAATSFDVNYNWLNPADASVINQAVPNAAPVNTVPGAQSTPEDTALVFSTADANAISVADPDAGTNPLRLSLTVTNGTLTLATVAGLTFNSGANGSTAMTFTGTAAQINAALNGLQYAPNANTNGPDLLAITTNDLGNTGTGGPRTDSSTVAINVLEVNDAPAGVPTITGTVTEDQVLSADTSGISDADGLGAFSYQWQRNGANIAGATASSYLLGDADVGSQIRVQVSYTDGHGTSESVASVQTAPVANVNDAPVGIPILTGTVTEDQTLAADVSGVSDADGLGAFTYQWLRNGVIIVGATGSLYTLGDGDVGSRISVQVSYTDGRGTNESVTSAQTAPVANVNDAPGGVPVITGAATEDQTLTADVSIISDADGLGPLSYQWLRNGVAVGGAVNSTYTLVNADVGSRISVQVSYTDGHATTESVTSAQSAAVANVNDAPGGVPTITGTVTEDQVLTADVSGISDADGLGVFSYQWVRDGGNIGGATTSTYTLVDADVGSRISVQVTYTDGHGTSESLTSVQTAAVANLNDGPLGAPTLTGTAVDGQVLTADTSEINDADGLGAFSYQWLRDGSDIAGATASAYTLTGTDVGAQISVVVSYTDGHGSSESVTSTQTPAVAALNVASTAAVPDETPPGATPVPGVDNPRTNNISNRIDLVGTQILPLETQTPPFPGEPDPSLGGGGTVNPPKEPSNEEAPKEALPAESSATPNPPAEDENVPTVPPTGTELASILSPKESSSPMESARDERPGQSLVQGLRPAGSATVMRASDYQHLRDSLDAVRQEIAGESRLSKVYLGSAIVSSIGLSVGYVVWILRGGMLLASLLSSMPAWQFLDPLPILARKRKEDPSEDKESLESIVEKQTPEVSQKKKTADGLPDAEVKRR
jgi:uncharacterized lipoprotein